LGQKKKTKSEVKPTKPEVYPTFVFPTFIAPTFAVPTLVVPTPAEKDKPLTKSEFLSKARKLNILVDDSSTALTAVTAHPCGIGNKEKYGWQVSENKELNIGLSKPVKTRITVKIEVITEEIN